jgi:hypothetical protein
MTLLGEEGWPVITPHAHTAFHIYTAFHIQTAFTRRLSQERPKL